MYLSVQSYPTVVPAHCKMSNNAYTDLMFGKDPSKSVTSFA